MRSASPLRRAISIPMRRNEVLHDSPLEGAGFEPSVPRGHVEDAPWNFDVVHRGWHTRYKSINSSRRSPARRRRSSESTSSKRRDAWLPRLAIIAGTASVSRNDVALTGAAASTTAGRLGARRLRRHLINR